MRSIAILALAFFAGLLASLIAGFFFALVCYGASLASVLTGPNAMVVMGAFSVAGILAVFRATANFVLEFFDEPFNIPTEETQPPLHEVEQKPDNTLLRNFDLSTRQYGPTSTLDKQTKLLSSEEIDSFVTYTKTKNEIEQQHLNKQLEQYKHYINDACRISLEPIKDLKEPVTIEGKHSGKTWTRTYDKASIREWIKSKGPHAPEPEIRCDLSNASNKIEIYSGFPTWICQFILFVRSILKPEEKITERMDLVAAPGTIDIDTPSRVLTPNHRNALHAGYPTLFSTPAGDFTSATEQKPTPVILSI